jgi:hypothetical protein
LKHEICKVRAAQHARETGQRVVWSPAEDTAKADALIHDKDLRAKKKEWLQYHHRKCNSLWGMLPLVVGMRVALVDHLDRSDKCLLRGSTGTLLSWVLDPREPDHANKGDIILRYPPKALIVRFDDSKWSLDGMPEPGTYPVKLQTKCWHVDSNRKQPVLRVSRKQLPVGPDYARTAYSTQGLTLDAAFVDLCFDEITNIATAYVALSRVRSADDILIMQPFELSLFQKGIPVGPKMLLKKLRGEDIKEDIAEHLQFQREQRQQEQVAKEVQKQINKDAVIVAKRVKEKKKRRDNSETLTKKDAISSALKKSRVERAAQKRNTNPVQKELISMARKESRDERRNSNKRVRGEHAIKQII